MDFGWLKIFFKKKSLSNTNTSDISTIDTSFIRVPKLSELSYEDRLLVDKYIDELKHDDNDYEPVLKYSDELLNKSNMEIEFFMINLDEMIKDISSIINSVNEENYFKILIIKEEIKQNIDEFYKIINETKLRLYALDAYIKKEDKRKYDFLGIFGKAERLKFLNDKSKLLNEIDRLKTTIKISNQHLLASFKALKEEEILLINMETYINSSKSFDTSCCDYKICKKYVRELIDKKEIIDYANCKELYNIYYGLSSSVSNDKMKELHSNIEYQKMVPFLSKENREIKKYAFEHRNDYKIIIKEIKELIRRYETTSSSKWDINELEITRSEYYSKVKKYIIPCKRYVNDDILTKLKEYLFHLNYFYYTSNDGRLMCGYSSPMPNLLLHEKYIMDFGATNFDIIREFGHERWGSREEEKKYYYKLSCDMLKKIGILNLPIRDYNGLEKRLSKVVNYLEETGELHYLFDIYNNDYECINLLLNEHGFTSKKSYNPFNWNFNLYHWRLDDIFYIDKYLEANNSIIEELFTDNYSFSRKMNKDFFKILIYSYIKKIDLQYDNRIIILPCFIQSPFPYLKDNSRKEAISIYVSTTDQLNFFNMRNDKYSIKYIFIKEELLEKENIFDEENLLELEIKIEKEGHEDAWLLSRMRSSRVLKDGENFWYNDLYHEFLPTVVNDIINNKSIIKIITVPNDTKYSELSRYLDQELAKKQEQTKLLCKVK